MSNLTLKSTLLLSQLHVGLEKHWMIEKTYVA